MAERVADPAVQAAPEPAPAEHAGPTLGGTLSAPAAVLALQRTAGNAAVARYLAGGARPPPPSGPESERIHAPPGARALADAVAARRPPAQIARTPAAEADPDANVSLGPLDDPIVTLFAGSAIGEGRWTVLREFLRGTWGGVQSAPADQMARIEAKFEEFGVLDALKYGGGFNLGIPEGLWISVKGLAEAVWTLVKLPYEVNQFLLAKVPELAAKYGPRLVELATEGDGIGSRLAKAMSEVLQHPKRSLDQLGGFLDALKALGLVQVRALGRGAAGKLLDFIELPWFSYGRELGKIAGQIIFEVVLAVASDLIANVVKEALAVATRLATRAVTGMVELLRSAGRMLGQTVEWLQGVGRRVTGEMGELFEAAKALLSRIASLLDELAGEGVLAETGAGGMPVPSGPVATNVFESRVIRRPAGSPTVADLSPPKVHPSKLPPEPPPAPRSKFDPSRYGDEEIAEHLDEVRGQINPGDDDIRRPVELGKTALEEAGVQVRTLQKVDQYHHLFVQQLKKWFKSKGIDIDRYTVLLSSDEHRWIHNEYRWNDLWKDYMAKNPGATADQIIAQLEVLKTQVGLEGLDVVPYPR